MTDTIEYTPPPLSAVTPDEIAYAKEQMAMACVAPPRPPAEDWAGRDEVTRKVADRFQDTEKAPLIVAATIEELWKDDKRTALQVEKEFMIIRNGNLLRMITRQMTRPKVKIRREPAKGKDGKPILEWKIRGGKKTRVPKMIIVHKDVRHEFDTALFARYKELQDQRMELLGIDRVTETDAVMAMLKDTLDETAKRLGLSADGVTITNNKVSIQQSIQTMDVSQLPADVQSKLKAGFRQIRKSASDSMKKNGKRLPPPKGVPEIINLPDPPSDPDA